MSKHQTLATAVIETARTHVGYRARAQKVSIYGAKYNVDGQPWAGSFIETVMRESGERGQPAFVSTTAALAEYVRLNRIYSNPKPGDIVFFAYSTDGSFTQPHVGLVTDTEKWKSTASFKAISGQTQSGLPRGPQESDGVYERQNFASEVLAFARPKYGATPIATPPEHVLAIHPGQFVRGKSTNATVFIQQALFDVQGTTGFNRARYDAHTASAIAQFQRHIGYHGEFANGQLDETTLRRLALESGFRYFKVDNRE